MLKAVNGELGLWSMEALDLIGMETDPLEEAAGCNVVSFFFQIALSTGSVLN